jgi:hypothetical protein
MIINYGTMNDSRNHIINLVSEKKKADPNYKVVDIGGSVGGWSSLIADLIIDFNPKNDIKHLGVDICNEESWGIIQNLLKDQNIEKFDYAICTHTLEDLYNPVTVLKWLPKIAKGGVITMPSMRTELSRIENKHWLGYIHHRWIFDRKDDEMLIIPKITALEALVPDGLGINNYKYEIRYYWENDIPHKIFMNNYLGPTVETVISEYSNLIQHISH